MELESFLGGHTRAGQLVDADNRFTLNQVRAPEHLASVYLTSPSLWLQRLIQAALGLEAGPVRVRVTDRHTEVGFSCSLEPPSPTTVWEHLEAPNLIQSGLLGATAQKGELLYSVNEMLAVVGLDRRVSTSRLDAHPGKIDKDQAERPFHLLVRLKRQTQGGFWQRVKETASLATELGFQLRAACRYCPHPVYFDGRLLNDNTKPSVAPIVQLYLLGTREQDAFLSETSPGCGSARFDFCEERLDASPHFTTELTVWDTGDGRLFASAPTITEAPEPFQGRSFLLPVRRSKTPENSLAIYRHTGWSVESNPVCLISYVVPVPPELMVELTPRRTDHYGLRCQLCIRVTDEERNARVRVVRHGIVIEEVNVDLGCPGLDVIVSLPALRTDASTFGIIKDKTWEEMLQEVQRLTLGLLESAHTLDFGLTVPRDLVAQRHEQLTQALEERSP